MKLVVNNNPIDLTSSYFTLTFWEAITLYCVLMAQYEVPYLNDMICALGVNSYVVWDIKRFLSQKSLRNAIIKYVNARINEALSVFFNDRTVAAKMSVSLLVDWDKVFARLEANNDDFFEIGNESVYLRKEGNQICISYDGARFVGVLVNEYFIRRVLGFPNAFYLPSERIGMQCIFHELRANRTAAFHNDKSMMTYFMHKLWKSSYTVPVAHYIDWLGDLSTINRRDRAGMQSLANAVGEIVGGRFVVDEDGLLYFTDGNTTTYLHSASLAQKNLFGLYMYLAVSAKYGDLLIIEAPYLGLNDEEQLNKVFGLMIDNGIHVVVVSH